MARLNVVNKAAKDYPEYGIKKGEPYYWWKFRRGAKQFSKEKPPRSRLTQSDFYSQLWSIEDEQIAKLDHEAPLDELQGQVTQIIEDLQALRDEQEEKKSNMPDSLQESATGELLQERYDALNQAINELEGINLEVEDTTEEKQEIVEAVQAVSIEA